MTKKELLENYVIAIRERQNLQEDVRNLLPGLFDDLADINSSTEMWADSVVSYLLDNDDVKVDALFEDLYNSDKSVQEIMEKIVCL